jgi:hypothetical protein
VQGSLDQPPIVLRARRVRAVWTAIGSAAFGTLFVWDPTDPVLLIFSGFFGFTCVVALSSLVVRPRLEVGPSGLTQTVLWRTKSIGWADVYNFRPAMFGLTNRTVGFDYVTARPKRAALRLDLDRSHIQGWLRPGWEIEPQALAKLLNDAREHWLTNARSAP